MLTAYELDFKLARRSEGFHKELKASKAVPFLVLKTCQRIEVFTRSRMPFSSPFVLRKWEAQEAFERFVRVAAGLESRMPGELEILGQVRTAYNEFRQLSDDVALDKIFQDALALARKARRESGIDQNLVSLGSLAARTLLDAIPEGAPVAVVGAGSLARSVAKYLGKRGESPITISSRCPEKAMSLASKVGGYSVGLDNLSHLFKDTAGIITATAAPHPVVYVHHLELSSPQKIIIDLGVPPDCCSQVKSMSGVAYYSLEDIESRVSGNATARKKYAKVAAEIIRKGSIAWSDRSAKQGIRNRRISKVLEEEHH